MTGPVNRVLPAPTDSADEIREILGNYDPSVFPRKVEYLAGAGGFSGARLWRLSTEHGDLCLRQWPPEHPPADRLAWIHSVLRYAVEHGFDRLPLPISTCQGKTWVERDRARWELSRWLAGRADYWTDPRPAKLRAAMEALAQFHLAVSGFSPRQAGPSAAVLQRRELLAGLSQRRIHELDAAVRTRPEPVLQDTAGRLLHLFHCLAEPVGNSLEEACGWTVYSQPCLRDVWHDHVLYLGDMLIGFIDFGAMREDCVSTDIARLLGSLVGSDANRWRDGLSYYTAIRPLSEAEIRLIRVLDHSGVLLGGINWLDWIYCQQRQFGNLAAVRDRLLGIVDRLESLHGAGKNRLSLALTPPSANS